MTSPPRAEAEPTWEAEHWTRSDRLLIGAFTAVPALIGLTFLPVYAVLRNLDAVGHPLGLWHVWLFQFLAVIVLMILYIPAAFNNSRLSSLSRRAWLAGFVVMGFATIPLYWWLHIWRAPRSW